MQSFRFVFTRRWLIFALVVAFLAYATWWLGNWQFDRLHNTRHNNGLVRTNLAAKPVDVAKVLNTTAQPSDRQEWRRVTATGTYDTAHTVTWLYQTSDDSVSGIDVVVPFDTTDGPTLIVDRGWLASTNQGDHPVAIPAAPSGQITITGWVRVDATGGSTRVDQSPLAGLTTRAVSSSTIASAIGAQSAFRGFVDLQAEDPKPATPLAPVDLPALNDGPHFFYGIQWWFFGVLAVFGFFYFMYDERRSQRRPAAAVADAAVADAAVAEELPVTTPEPAPAPVAVAARTQTVPSAWKQRRAVKNARKQALRAAYQAAYERDRETRTKVFGTPQNPYTKDQASASAPASSRTADAAREN